MGVAVGVSEDVEVQVQVQVQIEVDWERVGWAVVRVLCDWD